MYESNPAFDGKNISETDGESHGAFLSESETIHEPQGEGDTGVYAAIMNNDNLHYKTEQLKAVLTFEPSDDSSSIQLSNIKQDDESISRVPRSLNPSVQRFPEMPTTILQFGENLPETESSKTSASQRKLTESENDVKTQVKYTRQFFAAFAANFGAVVLGAVMSWTSTALPDLRERKSVGEISVSEEAWISTLSLLGAASACPIVGYGIERFGRKRCLLLLTAPYVGGWILISLAQNIWMIYLGRFLSGFCGGGGSIAIPVYVTESSSAHIRGMMASGFDMMITVGILYIFVIGTFVSWEWQAVACGFLPIVFHFLMLLVPESPTYLVEQKRYNEASKALQWLRGASCSQQVEIELEELISSVQESESKSSRWMDLGESSALKPTLLAVGLMVFQQLACIDAITFYMVDIFNSSGTTINENVAANVVAAIQVVATITAAALVDHSGRRFLLLFSELFMVISLGSLGVCFYLKEANGGNPPPGLGMLPLASLLVYVVAFSVGMGPLPWLLMGELVPSHIKGKSSGIVTITRWIFGFAITFLFQFLMKKIQPHGCYWLFAGCCFVGGIFVYVFIPETKGKSLDEIQEMFAVPTSDRRSKKYENKEDLTTGST